LTVITDGIDVSTRAGAGRLILDAPGNLGLGVTPSAWVSTTNAIQLKESWAAISSDTNFGSLDLTNNAYQSATSTWNYRNNLVASRYRQVSGTHQFFTAPSGTAGNAISFTQAMTLTATGQLNLPGGVISSQGWQSNGASYTTAGSIFNGVYAPADNIIAIATNGSERARIDSNGNLLVGTTSQENSSRLTVFTGSNAASFRTSASTGSSTGIVCSRSGNNGNVAEWKYSTTITVGSVSVTATTTTYNTSSDYRLKNITGPITNSGAYIDSLNPVEGTWKADGSAFVGLIAHEVQEASRTNVATGVKDGEQMQGMDYSSAEIIANLIAEVKSLRARLAAANI
jgi:hypothetical protein